MLLIATVLVVALLSFSPALTFSDETSDTPENNFDIIFFDLPEKDEDSVRTPSCVAKYKALGGDRDKGSPGTLTEENGHVSRKDRENPFTSENNSGKAPDIPNGSSATETDKVVPESTAAGLPELALDHLSTGKVNNDEIVGDESLQGQQSSVLTSGNQIRTPEIKRIRKRSTSNSKHRSFSYRLEKLRNHPNSDEEISPPWFRGHRFRDMSSMRHRPFSWLRETKVHSFHYPHSAESGTEHFGEHPFKWFQSMFPVSSEEERSYPSLRRFPVPLRSNFGFRRHENRVELSNNTPFGDQIGILFYVPAYPASELARVSNFSSTSFNNQTPDRENSERVLRTSVPSTTAATTDNTLAEDKSTTTEGFFESRIQENNTSGFQEHAEQNDSKEALGKPSSDILALEQPTVITLNKTVQ